MGHEIYWNKIRRHSPSIVAYLESYWPADKESDHYRAYYTMAATLDASLEATYQQYGQDGVEWVLHTDPSAEATLNTLAAEWHLLTHGDPAGAARLRAIQPPGSSDMAPEWAVTDALAMSTALYKEAERGQAGWGSSGSLRNRYLSKGRLASSKSQQPPGPKAPKPKSPGAKGGAVAPPPAKG